VGAERYRLGDRLGAGGMAEVHEGVLLGAAGFTRPVAIKRMHAALSAEPRFGAQFVDEARIAALLHHPNIAAVLDFDRDDDGRYFLVMELIRGVDLRRLLAGTPLPLDAALHVVVEVLRGLTHAHELEDGGRVRGVLHRDVSPHNVMVSWDGAVKLVDFGIARAIAASDEWRRTTGLRGKVAYMSPEQARGDVLDHRSDQFAAGIVAYELVTGRRVFAGASDPEILARLLTQPIPRAASVARVPPAVDVAIMRMLERDVAARWPSTTAALEAILACPEVSARGGLALRDAIRARFPDEAPRRRDDAGAGEATPRAAAVAGAIAAAPAGATRSFAPAPAAIPPPRATPVEPGRGRFAIGLAVLVVAAGLGALVARRAFDGAVSVASAPSDGGVAPSPSPPPTTSPTAPDAGIGAASPDAAPPAPRAAVRRGRGTLEVRVAPWARVVVDGVERGTTPQILPLAAGDHRVVIENRELDRRERVKVRIAPGEVERIDRRW
jgi:serine/threonine-protein kinase